MERPYYFMSGPQLIERLRLTSELLHEVGEVFRPYYPSEWNGLDRTTQYNDLARECDALIAECEQREIDWYEAYWGEPRKEPIDPIQAEFDAPFEARVREWENEQAEKRKEGEHNG